MGWDITSSVLSTKLLYFRIGFVYDERMLEHKCDWDNHPEQPDRIRIPHERCLHYGLVERCSIVPVRTIFLFRGLSHFVIDVVHENRTCGGV